TASWRLAAVNCGGAPGNSRDTMLIIGAVIGRRFVAAHPARANIVGWAAIVLRAGRRPSALSNRYPVHRAHRRTMARARPGVFARRRPALPSPRADMVLQTPRVPPRSTAPAEAPRRCGRWGRTLADIRGCAAHRSRRSPG